MPAQTQAVIEQIYSSMERRIEANPPGLCPVDMTLNFLNLCQAQTCGKCVPCRIGLDQLSQMIREILDGQPDADILDRIKTTAQVVVDSADCAIGIDAGQLVLNALVAFRDDFEEHVKTGRCLGGMEDSIPCVAKCPAAVDIPGYVALVHEGRCADLCHKFLPAVFLVAEERFPGQAVQAAAMASAVGQLVKCGGVILCHALELFPKGEHYTIISGAVKRLVTFAVLQRHA